MRQEHEDELRRKIHQQAAEIEAKDSALSAAKAVIVDQQKEIERLKADVDTSSELIKIADREIERLKSELQFAAEALESWGAYAPNYFRTKHHFDDDLERVKKAAE